MKACVISFGPIESRSNGYFTRVWNVVKEVSRFCTNTIVLEFPERDFQYSRKMKNTVFIRLPGNQITVNRFSRILSKFVTFDPIHGLKFQIASSIQLLKCWKYISSADLVIIEGSYIPAANILASLLGKKIMLDTHGINRLLAGQYRRRKKLVYVLRTLFWDFLERLTMKLSDIVIVVSEKERKFAVREYHVPEFNVFIVPNAIEVQQLSPRSSSANELRGKLGLEDKTVVTFIGDLQMVQNADSVDYITHELAPQIWEKRKDITFLITGNGKIRFNCNLPNVIFTGFIEDLSSLMLTSDVCIAPMRVGCGVKTKMLEYLVHGKPIITTDVGAEGLESIISSYAQKSVRVVPLSEFSEVLLDTISNLHKMDLAAVPNRLFLEDFEKKLYKVLLHASEV